MPLLSDIPNLVQKLKEKYDTNDPFKIAKENDIQIIFRDFGDEVFGFYNKNYRIKFIHLSSRLNEEEMIFCCAHELMHALYHPEENTPRLSRLTLNSTSKIEAQANCGATNLLIDDSHKFELQSPTKREILNYYGLPVEMEIYL